MRKKSLIVIPLALLAIVGGYAATGLLFPDTANFPRLPIADNTIGGMFSRILGTTDLLNYDGDGTAHDTLTLSGIGADGLLKRSDVCPSGQYWTGIDAGGTAVCGSTAILLADMGTITEVTNGMTLYRADGTTISPINPNTIIKSGDIIMTDATGTGTITFSDSSIIRLDRDTTITLDQVTTATGTTIATALLENGAIWGRILTETGVYNIGSSDIVAAVRGTSISVIHTGASITTTKMADGKKWTLNKTGTQGKTLLSVVDSSEGVSTPIAMTCREGSVTVSSTGNITPEKTYMVSNGDCIGGSVLVSQSPADLYTMNSWIRENTKSDINYLSSLVESGAILGIIGTPKYNKLIKELKETTPGSTTECANLLGGDPDGDCNAIVSTKIEESGVSTPSLPPEAPKMVRCKIKGKKYWSIYRYINGDEGGSQVEKECQEAGILAIADYTIIGENSTDLYLKGGKLSIPTQTEEKLSLIKDERNFWNSFNGGSSDFPTPINGIWLMNDIRIGSNCIDSRGNCYNFANSAQYGNFTSFYIPLLSRKSPPTFSTHGEGWDWYRYTGGIYGRKIVQIAPIAGQGVSITGNQYLSYPLSQLQDEIGGLAGKTIEIELDNINTTGRILTLSPGLFYSYDASFNWYCNASRCSSIGYPVPNFDGNKLIIKLPNTGITYEYFKIGNNNSGNAPINKKVKHIKIY